MENQENILTPVNPNKIQFTKRERTSGIGGHHCEIKLAMFFLLDGMIKKEKGEIKNFYIASNMAEAGDFDDAVYRYDYEENGVLKTRIIFLQAKHKDNEENISKETLLSENRRNKFMLKKYMSSYWKIKEQFKTNKEPIFSNKIEDCELILYTNAGYNFFGKDDIVTEVEITKNDLLNFKAKHYYKLKIENGCVVDPVLKILRNPMDFSPLINELRFSVQHEHPSLELGKQIIEDYQYPLSTIVFEQINPDEAKLKENFLNSDSDFAKSFLQEIIKSRGVNNNLREIKLKVNPNFWNSEECPLKLSLPPKEFSDDDILKFAERLKIFTSQLNEKELTEEIKKMIQKGYDVEQQDIDSVYSEIRIKVTNWWQNQKKHNFLTEATKKIHKAIRKSVRFEIRDYATPFVGRIEKLQELHRDLQNNGEILISQIATVTGLGGVGKSELARKYISDHAKDYDNNLIWIIAESYSTLVESFRKLAKQLKIETQDENGRQKDIMKIVKEVYKYFAERKRKSLFVFDNAGKFKTVEETDEGLDKFLPTGLNKPYVIITSRNQNWSENIAKIELNVFTLEEAFEFITKALGDFEFEEGDREELAEKLQYLPLALKQAVAYIRAEDNRSRKLSTDKFTIGKYLEKYDEFSANLLDLNVDGYTGTVYTTYSVTMNQIRKRHFGKEAEEIIKVLAYVSPDNIPYRGMFTNLVPDTETLSDAAQLLNQYSMANLHGGLFNIHRVVQDVIRIQLRKEEKEENVLRSCLGLLQVHIGNIQNKTGGPYTTHAVKAWGYAKIYADLVKLYSRLPAQITDKLEESTRYEEAFLFGSEQINLLENVLGPNNPDFLPIMNTIGTVHAKCGDYEKAKNVQLEHCKKSTEILGESHPDTIMAESNVTVVMDYQGLYNEALRRHQQIYEKRKQILGENHYDTLTSRYNIGVEYQKLGDFNTALEIYKEILLKYRELFQDEDHEDILMIKNSIAIVLKNLGKYDEALMYYNEVLPGRKRVLGDDHPETLLTLHGIAVVYEEQEKYNEALEAYQEVAEKRRQKFSDDHPDVLGTENNIGGILLELGRCQEALELHQQIYQKRCRKIGENHPDTLMSLHNIGLAYEYLNDDDCALAVYRDALAGRKIALGENHIETLKTECNIAGIYSAKGDNPAALRIYQRVLPIFEKNLGYYNPYSVKLRQLLQRATQIQTRDQLSDIYADFDVDLLHIALGLKDISFVDKYLNDYRSQIVREDNKAKIRDVIDKAYLRLINEDDGSGNLQIIIMLLSTAIEETAEDCLCRAVNNNSVELVKYLLENSGADPRGKNKEEKTALEISSEKLNMDPENEVIQTICAMLISMEIN